MEEKYADTDAASYTKALQAMYFKEWEAPMQTVTDDEEETAETESEITSKHLKQKKKKKSKRSMLFVLFIYIWTVAIFAFSVFMSIWVLAKYWYNGKFIGKYDGYKVIGSDTTTQTAPRLMV